MFPVLKLIQSFGSSEKSTEINLKWIITFVMKLALCVKATQIYCQISIPVSRVIRDLQYYNYHIADELAEIVAQLHCPPLKSVD